MGSKSSPLLLKCSLLLVMIFLVEVEAESTNITIGSVISTSPNHVSSWLSPSTNFSFGFYPLSSENKQYVIGIWLTNTCSKTLVWSLSRNDPPLSGTNSSILFDHDGLFIVQVDGYGMKNTKPLLGNMVTPSASYAFMHDDGNFAVYNSDSEIIWQSFDYPTDTILVNQKLKSGYSLISSDPGTSYYTGRYELVMQQDGDLKIYDTFNKKFNLYLGGTSMDNYVSLNLDSNGDLNLVDSNNFVIENLNHQQREDVNGIDNLVYRATLDSDGKFCLYAEMDCFYSEKPKVLWYSPVLKANNISVDLWTGTAINFIVWPLLIFLCLKFDVFYIRKIRDRT